MSDLLSDSEFDIIVFTSRKGREYRLKRLKRTRMVGRPDLMKETIIGHSLYEVTAGNEVLVLEDGSISFLLSRVTGPAIEMLANMDLSQHREMFAGVECMNLNSLMTLADVQAHVRRTWPTTRAGRVIEHREGYRM